MSWSCPPWPPLAQVGAIGKGLKAEAGQACSILTLAMQRLAGAIDPRRSGHATNRARQGEGHVRLFQCRSQTSFPHRASMASMIDLPSRSLRGRQGPRGLCAALPLRTMPHWYSVSGGLRSYEPRYDVARKEMFLIARASHLRTTVHQVENNVESQLLILCQLP
jgi:hypothetical protein